MKSLILFDGSRSSQMTLLTACQDAHRQAACTKEGQLPEAHAVLVVAFEDMTALSNAGKGEYSVAAELEAAVQRLECCGDILKIRGEVIRCRPTEVTSVLIQRAKEWKATNLYFPVAVAPAHAVAPRRNWFGFGSKPGVQTLHVEQSRAAITSKFFNVSLLLEESGSKIVLTNYEGSVTRLHYCVSFRRPTAPVAVAARSKEKELVAR